MILLSLTSCSEDEPNGDGVPEDTSGGGGPDDSGDTDDTSSGDTADTGSEQTLTPGSVEAELNQYNPFSAVVRATFEQDVEVWAEYGEHEAFDRSTPIVAATAGETAEWLVHGLRADAAHQIRFVATLDSQSWTSDPISLTTDPLPMGFPEGQVESAADPASFDAEEVICTNSFMGNDWTPVYYCVDRWGEPRWWLRNDADDMLMAVRALSDGGFAAVSKSSSKLVVFSEKGEPTHQYTPLWFEGRTRFEHEWIDMHEVIEIAEGEWAGALAIITGSTEMIDGVGARMSGGIVVIDIDDDEVLWDWNAHGEPNDGVPIDPKLEYDRSATNQKDIQDWLHANALVHGLDQDGGQHFWVSARYQDWMIKVDVETDEVVWRFGYEGDFELVDDIDAETPTVLPPKDWIYHQHAPERLFQSGSRSEFVVFDNGNRRRLDDGSIDEVSAGYSRVVAFVLDEETMRAAPTCVRGAEDPFDPAHFFADYAGDADVLPAGDRLQYLDYDRSLIVEVDYPGGDEVWRWQPDDWSGSYRVNYFPSLYETTWWYQEGK